LSADHPRMCRLVSSGPLSQRMLDGIPRCSMIRSSALVTRRLPRLVADSERWRSAFRTDVDHDSEVMPISVPN
jgi:hypothetical protein